MTDLPINPAFEEELRLALDLPAPAPQFVADLGFRLRTRAVAIDPRLTRRPRLLPAWLVAGAFLLLALIVFVAAGPANVIAAVRGLFGYAPGYGLVQLDNGLRVLAEPVSQTRDGVTLSVISGLTDGQQTWINYRVDGIRAEFKPTDEHDPGCITNPYLVLPDGTPLMTAGGSGSGGVTWTQDQFEFAAIPAGVEHFSLVLPCLNGLLEGVTPADWQIPLALVPAPADFDVHSVTEYAAPAPTPLPSGGTVAPTTPPGEGTETSGAGSGAALQVEKLVDIGTGYAIQGSFTWLTSKYSDLAISSDELRLLDANGQEVPVEAAYDLLGQATSAPASAAWAIRTDRKDLAGPLTVELDAAQSARSFEAGADNTFSVDLGNEPQSGQSWTLDQTIRVGEQAVTVQSVAYDQNSATDTGLTITYTFDPERILNAAFRASDNQGHITHGSGGMLERGVFTQTIGYDMPLQGEQHFYLSGLTSVVPGPWTAEVALPAGQESNSSPTTAQPQVCLAAENWGQLQAQAVDLPGGLSGRVVVEAPIEDANIHFMTLYVSNLDGSQSERIAQGGWEALSPDGQRLIYGDAAGPKLVDLASGQVSKPDYLGLTASNFTWSPDSSRLAFTRSQDGVYISSLDGAAPQKVPGLGGDTIMINGWMPDGQRLVVTTLTPQGSQVQLVDFSSGEIQDGLLIDNRKGGFGKLSPDGTQIAFMELEFGQPNYSLFLANLDGSQKRLLARPAEGLAFSVGAFSPDGSWLALTARDPYGNDPGHAALLNLASCQVALPGLPGPITGWAAP